MKQIRGENAKGLGGSVDMTSAGTLTNTVQRYVFYTDCQFTYELDNSSPDTDSDTGTLTMKGTEGGKWTPSVQTKNTTWVSGEFKCELA